MSAVYDTIGTGYVAKRQPDPRIARHIRAALGAAARVLNVGADAETISVELRHGSAAETSLREEPAERPNTEITIKYLAVGAYQAPSCRPWPSSSPSRPRPSMSPWPC